MSINEFKQLMRRLEEEEQECIESCNPDFPGLFLDYQNNQGERRQFRVINITSSPLPGCFEADCNSRYQGEYFESVSGEYDPNEAVSSHRTFKIANIISAHIS